MVQERVQDPYFSIYPTMSTEFLPNGKYSRKTLNKLSSF